MNVRHVLIVLNVLAVAAIGVIAVIILRRHRDEEHTPANLTPFHDDETLEGLRLERVLGWSLICASVIAVTLPVVWLTEPWRMDAQIQSDEDKAIERGAVLFANETMEAYDSAKSLQCANCHGADASGGSAAAVFTDPDTGEARRVFWTAPALNTVLLRFDEEEVKQVLNYGRPGSPMQAFGLPGGGPKNEQAIDDIVQYLASVQLTPEEAIAQSEENLAAARTQAADQLASATTELADAEAALAELEADPNATEQDIADAQDGVTQAEAKLAWAVHWDEARKDITDGQLLFEMNCARCHTQGWSIFDPSVPNGTDVLGPAGGGGTLGFSLVGGEIGRFPDEQDHIDFVTNGSNANEAYGEGGQGSGRMPGFSNMLTEEMISDIVAYEREGLPFNDPSAITGESIGIDTEEGS